MPLLKGEDKLNRDAIFWHYPHYHHSTPAGAIRQGDWKLIELYEDGRLELYNLKDDPLEIKNLIDAPEARRKLRELKAELRRLQEVTGALPDRMPVNPEMKMELPEESIR